LAGHDEDKKEGLSMVKMVFAAKRQPHLSREEFQKYWLEKHGALAREKLPALRCKRYVQAHTMDTPWNDLLKASRNCETEAFDGIAEGWFESLDDLSEAFQTDEGQKASMELLEDEKNFVDHANSAMWFAEEHAIFG
jgi:uncharacterized protein (TIGR02118 family)